MQMPSLSHWDNFFTYLPSSLHFAVMINTASLFVFVLFFILFKVYLKRKKLKQWTANTIPGRRHKTYMLVYLLEFFRTCCTSIVRKFYDNVQIGQSSLHSFWLSDTKLWPHSETSLWTKHHGYPWKIQGDQGCNEQWTPGWQRN